MSPIRKFLLKRLCYAIAAVIIMLSLRNYNSKPFYYVEAGAWLLFAYQFILVIQDLQAIADDFFPPRVKEKMVKSTSAKIIYNCAWLLFFAGIIIMIPEATPLGNMVRGVRFFFHTAGIGLVVYVCLMVLFYRRFPSVFYESESRLMVTIGYFLGLFLLFPAIACFINNTWPEPNLICKEYKVVSKNDENSYFFECNIDGEAEQFEPHMPVWDKLEISKNVTLCLQKGFWGYYFVKEFRCGGEVQQCREIW